MKIITEQQPFGNHGSTWMREGAKVIGVIRTQDPRERDEDVILLRSKFLIDDRKKDYSYEQLGQALFVSYSVLDWSANVTHDPQPERYERPTLKILADGTVHDSHGGYNKVNRYYTVPVSGTYRHQFKGGKGVEVHYPAGMQMHVWPDTVLIEYIGPMPKSEALKTQTFEGGKEHTNYAYARIHLRLNAVEAGDSEAKIKALQDLVEAQAALIRVLLKTPGYPPKS